jgi:hypothetical protein
MMSGREGRSQPQVANLDEFEGKLGTRRGTRALTCWRQALFVLTWMGKHEDLAVLGAGFSISRATAYRYHAEAMTALARWPRTCTKPSRKRPKWESVLV